MTIEFGIWVCYKGRREYSLRYVPQTPGTGGRRLATGQRVRHSNPGSKRRCSFPDPFRQHRHWGPLSLLYNGYRDIPRGKAAGAWRGAGHPLPSSTTLWAFVACSSMKFAVALQLPFQPSPEDHSAYYTMGTGTFPGVKRPERGVEQPPHLKSPYEPLWSVLGRSLPLLYETFSSPALRPTQPPIQVLQGPLLDGKAAGAWHWPTAPNWRRGSHWTEPCPYSPYVFSWHRTENVTCPL